MLFRSGWKLIRGFLIGPGSVAERFCGDIEDADMRSTNLADAVLPSLLRVRSGNIVGVPSALPAGWRLVAGYLVGPTANLRGAKLSGADLSGADLSGADLTDAVLEGANLANAKFTGATMAGTVCPNGFIAGDFAADC